MNKVFFVLSFFIFDILTTSMGGGILGSNDYYIKESDKGFKFNLYSDLHSVIKNLELTKKGSLYRSNSITLQMLPNGLINNIKVTGYGFETFRGIHYGSSLKEIKNKYKELTCSSNQCIFEGNGNLALEFTIENLKVKEFSLHFK